MKKIYEKRKAEGLCLYCGKPAKEGRTRCEACARKMAEAEVLYKHKLKYAHKCVRCTKPLPDGWSFTLCEDCRVKTRAAQRDLRARRRERGECSGCGKVLTDKKYKTCPECRETSRWYYKRSVLQTWKS